MVEVGFGQKKTRRCRRIVFSRHQPARVVSSSATTRIQSASCSRSQEAITLNTSRERGCDYIENRFYLQHLSVGGTVAHRVSKEVATPTTEATVRTQFNRTVLLAGAIVTPFLAVIDLASSALGGTNLAGFDNVPYLAVIGISLWQLRRERPNADWIMHPVAYGLVALNVYEMVTNTDVGGVSVGATLAVVVVIGILGAVASGAKWLLRTSAMVIMTVVWGIWTGLESGMSGPDAYLQGLVPSVAILVGAWLLRWLVEELGANADEAARLAGFHEAIAVCAGYLNRPGTDSPEEALRALLAATDASSVFVSRNVEDPIAGLCTVMICEVVAEGIDEDPPGIWDLTPWTSVPYAFEALSSGRSIFFRIEDTGPTERDLYKNTGVEAECNIPIMMSAWVPRFLLRRGNSLVQADRL